MADLSLTLNYVVVAESELKKAMEALTSGPAIKQFDALVLGRLKSAALILKSAREDITQISEHRKNATKKKDS